MAADQTTKPSEPDKVTKYMEALEHPRKDVLEELRKIILSADKEIGEEIKWNGPTFFYAGEMPPSDPKEYKRYLVVSNLFRKDCIRLVFWAAGRCMTHRAYWRETMRTGEGWPFFIAWRTWHPRRMRSRQSYESSYVCWRSD
jgi:hypothetical protein